MSAKVSVGLVSVSTPPTVWRPLSVTVSELGGVPSAKSASTSAIAASRSAPSSATTYSLKCGSTAVTEPPVLADATRTGPVTGSRYQRPEPGSASAATDRTGSTRNVWSSAPVVAS